MMSRTNWPVVIGARLHQGWSTEKISKMYDVPLEDVQRMLTFSNAINKSETKADRRAAAKELLRGTKCPKQRMVIRQNFLDVLEAEKVISQNA